ncbi:armadillo-type protein [Haematococcus lacustris]
MLGRLALLVLLLAASPAITVQQHLDALGGIRAVDSAPEQRKVDAESAGPGHSIPEHGSMEDLLHWAIEHSDPQHLAAQAEAAKQQVQQPSLQQRQERVKELVDLMSHQPGEAQLLKASIALLTAPGSSQDEQLNALAAIQLLVEPIDNANDLKVLGGISPLVAALDHTHPDMRAAAAYALGTAASNNPTFQAVLLQLHPDIFHQLSRLVLDADEGASVKALYAVAALVRNLNTTRHAFLAAGGVACLSSVLAGGRHEPAGGGLRLRRKALSLLADLVVEDEAVARACLQQGLGGVVAGLLQVGDRDVQEKALAALEALMLSLPQEASQSLREAGAEHLVHQLHAELVAALKGQGQQGGEEAYTSTLLQLCATVQQQLAKGSGHTEL